MSEATPDTRTDNTEPERTSPGDENPMTPPSAEGQTAPTQQQPGAGGDGSPATGEVTDEMLPEDLQPSDDNPLAKPRDDDEEKSGLSIGPDGPQA